jgi:hypothetical protein
MAQHVVVRRDMARMKPRHDCQSAFTDPSPTSPRTLPTRPRRRGVRRGLALFAAGVGCSHAGATFPAEQPRSSCYFILPPANPCRRFFSMSAHTRRIALLAVLLAAPLSTPVWAAEIPDAETFNVASAAGPVIARESLNSPTAVRASVVTTPQPVRVDTAPAKQLVDYRAPAASSPARHRTGGPSLMLGIGY